MSTLRSNTFLGLVLLAGTSSQAWDLKLSENHTVQFHGFASQGFLASTDYDYLGESKNGSFDFTELGLNATYSPFNRTRIAVQGFAFDVGEVGDLKPFLDYASLEYTFNDYIGVRGGRVRRAAGIYNHIQDVDLARTSVLLPQGVYDARWRDFSSSIDGGVVFGSVPLSKAGSLSYELYAGQGTLWDDGGVAQWIEDGGTSDVDEFDQPLYVGGQVWWNTPVSGLRAGVSVAKMFDFGFTSNDAVVNAPAIRTITADSEVILQQFSLEYAWDSWTFQAEYSTYRYEGLNNGVVFVPGGPVMATFSVPSSVNPDAWYVSAAYRFNKWFEAGAYYTEHYADTSDRNGGPNSSQKDLALSLRFDAKDWWIIKLEGHYIRGTSLLQDEANNPTASRDDDGWFLFAAKTTFSF